MRIPFLKRPSMSASSFLSIAALAVVVPVICFAAYLISYVASLERSRAEQQAVEIAHHVSEVVDGELSQFIASLNGLAASSALARWDLQEFHDEARRLVRGRDHIIVLRNIDTTQWVNTGADFGSNLPPAIPLAPEERELLLAGQIYVSGVYVSPFLGEPRIAVAIPVTQNQTTYVLALTVPTTRLRDVLLGAAPPGWLIGVGDRAGKYVTRSARHDEVSGQPTDPTYLAKVSGASGSFMSATLDGVMSLAGYVRSPLSGWVYVANVPYAAVTAPARRSLWTLIALGMLTVLSSFGITNLLSRRFAASTARLTEQAAALGAGRTPAAVSTGLTEFELVSRALEEAGAAIEERTKERERAREREALLGSVLDSAELHVGVVMIKNAKGRLVVASRAASEFFSKFEDHECGSLLAAPPLAEWSALVMRAAKSDQAVGAEYAISTESSVRLFMGTFVRLSAAGVSSRVAFISSDITARHDAEEIARSRSQELETVLATVPAAVWFTYDIDARETIRNRFARALLRDARLEIYSEDNPTPSPGSVQFYADGKPVAEGDMPLRKAMRGHGVDEQEYEFRFWDNQVRVALMSTTALQENTGKLVGAVAVALDVTERKRADDQRRLLINELNHRVKNTLASVQSLVSQSLRGASSPSHAAQVVTERLVALAKAHDLLTRESWEGADLKAVVQAATAAYGEASRFDVSGPSLWLKPSLSLSFAMALHELTTNATKYGALSVPDGRVIIRWSLNDDNAVKLQWREVGGPKVSAPARRGFGSRLIERSFASENGGRADLRFEPDGLLCEIVSPLGQ